MNIYAIGDIHGCLSELTSLHKKILTNNTFKVKEDLLIQKILIQKLIKEIILF